MRHDTAAMKIVFENAVMAVADDLPRSFPRLFAMRTTSAARADI